MNDTLSIDLTLPFSTSSNVQINKLSKSPNAPILDYGALWSSADSSYIYTFGGVVPTSAQLSDPSVGVWQYVPSGKGLSYVSVPSSSSPQSPTIAGVRPTCAFSTYGQGVGYMLGGYDGAVSHSYLTTPVPGLLTYNMTANTWSNESAKGYSTYGTALNGRMHFLPSYGASGILAIFGGEFSLPSSWLEEGNNHVPFSNITLYDTENKSWYWQTATGNTGPNDIPPPATMFCSAMVSASGSGTTEIFIYGGHSDAFVDWANGYEPNSSQEAAQAIYNVVYVLSIPGFVWFKANDTSAHPRTGHSCEQIGPRSMISIGGLDPTVGWHDDNSWTNPWNKTDPWNQTLSVFDMTNLSWTGSYDPQAPRYEVPQVVRDWYARPSSNDSVKWTSPATQSLFFSSDTSNTTSSGPFVTATPNPSPSPSLSGGAIAGIVVAAVVALALLIAIVYFFARPRRRQQTPMSIDTGMSQKGITSGGGEYTSSELLGRVKLFEMDPSHSRLEMDGNTAASELAESDLAQPGHVVELPLSSGRG